MNTWRWLETPLSASDHEFWMTLIVGLAFVIFFGIMAWGQWSAYRKVERLRRERDDRIFSRRLKWIADGHDGLPPPEPGDMHDWFVR